jgi:hypothetical protein
MKPDEIRRDIEGTRMALGDKLERLETEVRDTVRDAREVVEDGIDKAKEMVSFQHQVEQRPWTFFAGSVGMGMAIGHMLTRAGARAAGSHHPTLADRMLPIFESELKMLKGAAFTMLLGMMKDVANETVKPALTEFVDKVMGSREPVAAH